jgi:hypothetical protein
MHKPLAFVGANAAVALSPFLTPFFGYENVGKFSAIFQKRENIEKLLDRLAEPPVESTALKEA